MADPLAEVLNRINADPQTATPPMQEQHWTRKLASALLDAGRTVEQTAPRVGLSMIDLATLGPLRRDAARAIEQGDTSFRDTRTYAGQAARIPTDVVGGAVGLPLLPDLVAKLATGNEDNWYSRNTKGMTDTLAPIAGAVHEKGEQVGEAIAGRPLNDSLLNGNVTDLGASWTRLLAGAAMPIPGSWQAKMSGALSKVSAGNATAKQIASGAATTMEMLTPLTLNPKMVTPNIVASGVIAPTLEKAVADHEQAQKAIQASSERTKGALDVTAQGATEVRDAVAQHVVQANMLPSTGDTTADIAIGTTLLGATVLAGARFNVMGRALNAKKAGDPLDWTRLGRLDRAESQAADRTLPMWKTLGDVWRNQGDTSANVKEMRIKEDIASRQGMSSNMRQAQLYVDGTLPDSAIKVNPVQNLLEMYKGLSPEQQQLAVRKLISKREVSTRNIHKQWNDLFETDTRELGRYIAQADADPQVAMVTNEYKILMNRLADYTAEQRAFTKGEVASFKSQNPDFVATRKVGSSDRWLSPRNVTESNQGFKTFEEMGNPFELLPQYIDEVIRSTEGKKITRDVLMPLERARDSGDTVAKEAIGHTIKNKPPSETEGLYKHWRDPTGESRWTRVNDSYLRKSLQDVGNPAALQLHKGLGDIIADATSNIKAGPVPVGKLGGLLRSSTQQHAAVGVPAAITGSPFSVTGLEYTAGASSIARPPGIASGPIDKAFQDITQTWLGKRIGLPGIGTLQMPWHIFNAYEGARATLMQRGAVSLRNSIINDGPLSKLFSVMGPDSAEATSAALATAYKRHAAHDLRQNAIMGPSTYMSVDPSLAFRDAESMMKGGALKEFGQFATDILHSITSAPALTMYKSNKEMLNDPNTKARLMNAIRTMAGDPGASGLYGGADRTLVGKGAAHLTNSFPWANSGIIQPTFKLINSFRENPKGTVAGIFNYAVAPAILTTLYNAATGSDYSDHQFNIRPPDRVSSHIYIGFPGKAPDQGIEYAIDPPMRPFKLMGELLAGHILGIANGEIFKEENQATYKAVYDMSRHRWNPFNLFADGNVWGSMFNQAVMPPVPNVVQLPMALAGVPMHDWTGGSSARNNKHEMGMTEGTGPRGQMFSHMYVGGWLEDTMAALGAQAGRNILHMLDDTLTALFSGDMGRSEPNLSTKEALQKGVTGNFAQTLRTSIKEGTPLFDSYLAISPSKEASALAVQEKLNGLRKFSEAYASSTNPGGTPQMLGNKKIGMTDYTGVTPMGAQDDVMATFAREAGRIYKQLTDTHGAVLKSLYEDRNSIAQSNKFGPEEKRGMLNARAFEIIQANRKYLADIERQESAVSSWMGVPVKFDKVNLNRGSGQFK